LIWCSTFSEYKKAIDCNIENILLSNTRRIITSNPSNRISRGSAASFCSFYQTWIYDSSIELRKNYKFPLRQFANLILDFFHSVMLKCRRFDKWPLFHIHQNDTYPFFTSCPLILFPPFPAVISKRYICHVSCSCSCSWGIYTVYGLNV
jgi:hypothetical protein